MEQCLKLLKTSFPNIDEDVCSYIESVLETSSDDFESCDDLFEAVGEVLQEMDEDKKVLLNIVRTGSAWHQGVAYKAGQTNETGCSLCGNPEVHADHFLVVP